MREYLDLLKKILENGCDKDTRNGRVRSLFTHQLRFDVTQGFPAVTTKKLAFRSVIAELLWFLEGSTDVRRLKEIAGFDIKIWDGDAEQHFQKGKAQFLGDVGPIYGAQWRKWKRFTKINQRPLGFDWIPETCQ